MRIKGRVLFIGNDPKTSNLMVRIFNRLVCQTAAAAPDAALEMIAKTAYDYIVIDWCDGAERSGEYDKVMSSLTGQTAVYLFTGMTSGEEVKQAIRPLTDETVTVLSFDALVAGILKDSHRQIH